jgi:hypothetical protein
MTVASVAVAMRRIPERILRLRTLMGTLGLPLRERDFHRQ